MDKNSVESLEQHLDMLIETSRQLGKILYKISLLQATLRARFTYENIPFQFQSRF